MAIVWVIVIVAGVIAHHITPGRLHLGEDGADVGSVVGRACLTGEAVVHGIEMVTDVAHVPH